MSKRPSSLSTAEQAQLGARIARVVDAVGGSAEAARIAGITTKQLGRWVAGAAAPTATSLGKLVDRTSFALDWVVSGQGPERRALARALEVTAPIARALDASAPLVRVMRLSRAVVQKLNEACRTRGLSPAAETIHEAADAMVFLSLADANELSDEELVAMALEGVADVLALCRPVKSGRARAR